MFGLPCLKKLTTFRLIYIAIRGFPAYHLLVNECASALETGQISSDSEKSLVSFDSLCVVTGALVIAMPPEVIRVGGNGLSDRSERRPLVPPTRSS